MRVVFMGSPHFALPSLQALSEHYSVVAVVCQPDRPAGRGRQPASPPTKLYAAEVGIPVLQPEQLRDGESLSQITELQPELFVVAAYGQILPQSLLEVPEHGSLNVHASLLPRWRGAAPVQAAIRSGDEATGITIMLMDAGLDTGPIISQKRVSIEPDETGGSLTERLSNIGAELLNETIPGYLSGDIVPELQDDSLSTYAPMLKKSDGALDLGQPADQLARQIRAFNPWPGSFIRWGERRLSIKRAHAASSNGNNSGEVVLVENVPAIATPQGVLVLDIVQLSGKREMTGEVFIRGAPDFVGSTL
jgi:methionyl-tRNA formyltransferase